MEEFARIGQSKNFTEDEIMEGYFWFFLGLFMTISTLVMIKVSSPNER
jgi:hypothetical protein